MKTEVCIIGAGFAGIGAGLAAKGQGKQATIFEARDHWGGLCDNFTIDGFRFDQAVHLSFTENNFCRDVFFSVPHYEHVPESMNYCEGNWIRHPVQNNLRFLPVLERINVIQGFLNRPKMLSSEIKNYREWLMVQFGDYFAKKFPARYTRKYWGTEAENLSCNWCGNRIHQPAIDEVLLGAFPDAPVSENVYYAKKMNYPRTGGYKEFLAKSTVDMDIRYGFRVIRIDASNRIVYFENGEECKYNQLISTIPLPELVKMVCHESYLRELADSLQATSMVLISVGFSKKIKFPSLWFYIYDEDIPFARVHSPSMKSTNNVPQGGSSLQFEIYYSKEMPLDYNDGALTSVVLASMEKMGLALQKDVEIVDCRHVKYANVIFYMGMEKVREVLRQKIKGKGIFSCGRFGEWDYLWSDQSFLSGYRSLLS